MPATSQQKVLAAGAPSVWIQKVCFLVYTRDGDTHLLEVLMGVGVFALKVADNVTMVEVKGNFQHAQGRCCAHRG
jgi:hypothetical protein